MERVQECIEAILGPGPAGQEHAASLSGQISQFQVQQSSPLAAIGLNGAGKTSTIESQTMHTMMSDKQYEEYCRRNPGILQHQDEMPKPYEEGWDEFPEEPLLLGKHRLLSDDQKHYTPPTAVSSRSRLGHLLPIWGEGHSTRAISSTRYGELVCLSRAMITRRQIMKAMTHLLQYNQSLLNDDEVNDPLLRQGLEFAEQEEQQLGCDSLALRKRAKELPVEAVKVPRALWDIAGCIVRYYPDASLPLSQQLEQVSCEAWKWGTLVREGISSPSGNNRLAYVAALSLEVPSYWLRAYGNVTVFDHVGFTGGDLACLESYSRLNEFAGIMLVVSEVRVDCIANSLQTLDKSRVIHNLLLDHPHTPGVLMIIPAEKTTHLAQAADGLAHKLDALARVEGTAGAASCSQHLCDGFISAVEGGLQLLQAHQDISKQIEVLLKPLTEAAAATSSGMSSPAYGEAAAACRNAAEAALWLLNKRQCAETRAAAMAHKHLSEHALHTPELGVNWGNTAGPSPSSQQQQLAAMNIHVDVYWSAENYSKVLAALTGALPRLPADRARELLSAALGMSRVWEFVSSCAGPGGAWEQRQAAGEAAQQQQLAQDRSAADAFKHQQASINRRVLGIASSKESDKVVKQVEDVQQQLQGQGQSESFDRRLAEVASAAARHMVQGFLTECTLERGMAQGILMAYSPEELQQDVTDTPWQQQVGFQVPGGSLKPPNQYSKQLQGLCTAAKLSAFLDNGSNSSKDRKGIDVSKTLASCILAPFDQAVLPVPWPFVQYAASPAAAAGAAAGAGAAVPAAVDDLAAAGNMLAGLVVKLQSALAPSADAATDQELRIRLAAMQASIPQLVSGAFKQLCDLNNLFIDMSRELEVQLLIQQHRTISKLPYSSTMITRMIKLQDDFQASMAAVIDAVKFPIREAVQQCWSSFLAQLEQQVLQPLRCWEADQQHRQQQLQQPEECSKALRRLSVLGCYLVARGRYDSVSGRGNHALEAAVDSGNRSNMEVLDLLLARSDMPELFLQQLDSTLLPCTQQMQHLMQVLLAAVEVLPEGSATTCNSIVQQHTGLLEQCAQQLGLRGVTITLPGTAAAAVGTDRLEVSSNSSSVDLSPAEQTGLWLYWLPAHITVQQLHDMFHASEPVAAAGSAGAHSSSDMADIMIGSVEHLKLLLEVQDQLPYKLDSVRPAVEALVPAMPGADQAVELLLPSARPRLAMELYRRIHSPTAPFRTTVHGAMRLDFIAPAERLMKVTTGSAPAAAAAAAPAPAAAAAASSNSGQNQLDRLLAQMPTGRVYSLSNGQRLVRVIGLSVVDAASKGKPRKLVPVHVRGSDGQLLAVVELDRELEWPLCITNVFSGNLNVLSDKNKRQLDAQAPPAVLLAYLMHLQQQQQGPGTAVQPRQRVARGGVHDMLLKLSRGLEALRLRTLAATGTVQGPDVASSSSGSTTGNSSTADHKDLLLLSNWDVIEFLSGGHGVYYKGPKPASLNAAGAATRKGPVTRAAAAAMAAATAAATAVTASRAAAEAGTEAAAVDDEDGFMVVFTDFKYALKFAETGLLPSVAYLRTQRHLRALKQVQAVIEPGPKVVTTATPPTGQQPRIGIQTPPATARSAARHTPTSAPGNANRPATEGPAASPQAAAAAPPGQVKKRKKGQQEGHDRNTSGKRCAKTNRPGAPDEIQDFC